MSTSSSFQIPDDLEEQDIGLYYYSHRSSPALSDTDLSSFTATSRPASQLYSDEAPQDAGTPYPIHNAMKSSSLSHVAEVQQDGRPLIHQPILRSRTVPDLPSTASGHVGSENNPSSFVFAEERLRRMQEWVLAFIVVHFDLDLGPVVREVHPPMYLSPSEEENIAFSSFPDSLLFEQGSEVHSFRIKAYPESSGASSIEYTRPRSLDGFLYGFSHFSQKRNPSLKRGYQQSSLVLLAHHQYPALYTSMIFQLGPLFHNHGVPMLETACHNIASWQNPLPGSTVELGFLGLVLHVELPHESDSQQPAETSAFHERFNPTVHLLASSAPFYPPPVQLFEASLSHLWSLWECLVLCEPILVFGPSPSMTSQAIWWLRDLIRPIPLAMDIRPYFTIHDKDHAMLVNKARPKPGLLIGVTNPFFEKSCAHWSHILSVGRTSTGSRKGTHVVSGPTPGWATKTHRRHISKDRQLLKALERACTGDEAEQIQASLDLRRHFHARTNAMLAPLQRYWHTLLPSSDPSAVSARLKPFRVPDFLATLGKPVHGQPRLPFKSSTKQQTFYERWCRSPAFGLWLARQEELVFGSAGKGRN